MDSESLAVWNCVRREPGELSTLVSQPATKPSWKEEVNRRLEAHKSRRGISVVDQPVQDESYGNVSDRAAQAAARVAARYAKAPSFSEMQAAEARAALRAAEVATRKALEAQAAAQVALANLTAEEEPPAELDEALMVASEAPAYAPLLATEETIAADSGTVDASREPEMPIQASMQPEPADLRGEWTVLPAEQEDALPVELIEAAQPIPGNLIQFPRELVATRRMRPRLSEAPQSATGELFGQLSIFEVDPGMISTEPTPATEQETVPAPSWSDAEWTSLELDSSPLEESVLLEEEAPRSHGLELAPLGPRLLGTTVDLAIITGLAAAGAMYVLRHMQSLPVVRTAEALGVGLFLLVGLVYHAVSLLALRATPGMLYAGIGICTFDDEEPTHAQLRDRLVAMLVSLLPMGLGLAWSAFDENHLSWHDRLSRTYLRKR
jgi:hypothetical protein